MDGYPAGAIWPATEFDEVQIREVYSRYGLAMYMVQVLEHGMVNAFIVMRILPTIQSHRDKASWHATFDGSYEINLARTYGSMLRQLEMLDELPSDLLARLRAAKEDRDVLAHRFFRQNDIAFMNRDGRTEMIAWCEDRIEMFKRLSDELDEFIAPIQERFGISQRLIDETIAGLLEQARTGSRTP